MNIVDTIILLGLFLGAATGFVRGFFKQTVIFLGTILVVVLAFLIKNPLSTIMYQNLPFFKFGGLTALNILVYEVIAFIIAVTILTLILAIIIKITGIIEKILKFTVILALPSKLLGMIVGIIQSIVIMYIILFIMSLPTLKMDFLKDSKYTNIILTKTPIISNITNDIVKSFNEIAELTKIKIDLKDADNTNGKIVDVLSDKLPKLVEVTFKAYQTQLKKPLEDITSTANFGEYANPSFEAQVETVGKGKTQGIMSIEASVDELYGDSKDDKWKQEEVKRLKNEQGIVDDVEIPAINVPVKDIEAGIDLKKEGVVDENKE